MKELYLQYCEGRTDVPLFLQPWWLNVVCGEQNWAAVTAGGLGEINGVLPYYLTKKAGFNGIGMPPFTPFMGWHIIYPKGQTLSNKLSFEHKVVKELLQNLPRTSFFEQHLPPRLTNWLPAQWLGYHQTTRYTYVIPDISAHSVIMEGFQSRLRGAIQKASGLVEIYSGQEPNLLYGMLKQTYEKQGKVLPFHINRLEELVDACHKRGCGKLLYAKDDHGGVHAAAFIVHDGMTAWNILRASNERFVKSGAISYLLWKAILELGAEGVRVFDFVGSVVPGIEMYVRSYGTEQTAYSYISMENSIPYFWLRRLNDFRRQFLLRP